MRHTVISTPIGPERRATGRVRFDVLRGAILDARAVTKLCCFRSNSNLPKRAVVAVRVVAVRRLRRLRRPPPSTAATRRSAAGAGGATTRRWVGSCARACRRRRVGERARER